MLGKEKCRILKNIRAQIALKNDIKWVTRECQYQGECSGTCPKCEAEVLKLERELDLRRKLGKTVQIIGLSIALTACQSTQKSVDDSISGDISSDVQEGSNDNQEKNDNTENEIEVIGGEVEAEPNEQ